MSASHSSIGLPPSPNSPDNMETENLLNSKIIQTIVHLLKYDKRCVGNDTLLIMRVCERLGLCRYLRDYRGCSGWIFYEKDILSGRVPPGRLETIRRDRQKVMQYGLLNVEIKKDCDLDGY